MIKALVILLETLVIAAVIYITWLRSGISSTEWAIALIGGKKTTAQNTPRTAEDALFVTSLDYKPNFERVVSFPSNISCSAPDGTCLDNNLAIANVLAITGQDLATSKKLIEIYSSTFSESCPLKVELARLVYETSYLARNPNEKTASTLLEQIKSQGSLTHSINNAEKGSLFAGRTNYVTKHLERSLRNR